MNILGVLVRLRIKLCRWSVTIPAIKRSYPLSFVGPIQWRLPIGFQAVFALALLLQVLVRHTVTRL